MSGQLVCPCGFVGPRHTFKAARLCKPCWYAKKNAETVPKPRKKRRRRKKLLSTVNREWRLAQAWELAKRKAAAARAAGVKDRSKTRANRVHKRRCRRCRRVREARFMILRLDSPDHRGGTCCDCSKTRNAHLSYAERREIQRRVWAAAHAKRVAAASSAG